MSVALGERLAAALAVALGLLFVVEWVALRSTRRAPEVPPAPRPRPAASAAITSAGATAARGARAVRDGSAGGVRSIRRVARGTGTRTDTDSDSGPGGRRAVFVAAIVVGAAVRLAWVIWATRTPTGLRDPAEYLRIAVGFTDGDLPRFGGGGGPSAFWPPGYPAVLAPFVWVARQTGWASTAFVASLVNVAAGTATVALAGVLADRWFGRRARNAAAWLVALCPGLVYWTSTAHTETAFTPLFLGALVLASVAAARPTTRRWVLVGVLVAAAFLVRSPGVIALAAPALAIRSERGTWRGTLRPTLLVIGVAAACLVPWTIRNGLQVGFWSPASTNNAGAVCFGHHDEASALWEPEKLSQQFQEDCYGISPYAERRFAPLYGFTDEQAQIMPVDVDEVAWYRDATGRGLRWAITHPLDEVDLSARKVWETWSSDGRVVDGARNFAEPGWAGAAQGPLEALADWWGWLVGAAALVGLVVVPACRRALVVWVPIALYTLAIAGGVVDPHYRYPVVPLVAVLAAGAVAHVRRGGDPPPDAAVGEHGRSIERTAP